MMTSGTEEGNRRLWSTLNEDFADAEAEEMWGESGIHWGLFRLPETEVNLLGDVSGADVAELGCGTAFLSAALARAGARAVGVDPSRSQLRTARRCRRTFGLSFPLVEADAQCVPFAAASFDLVVSEYGAAPWCDPRRWLTEAARILRPGGRLVCLTNSVLAGLCVPADGGFAGDRLLRGQRELRRVTWPGGGTEHHPSHGEWIRGLRDAGFEVDALHELYPPAGTRARHPYEIVTGTWAQAWPAEEVWAAHVPS